MAEPEPGIICDICDRDVAAVDHHIISKDEHGPDEWLGTVEQITLCTDCTDKVARFLDLITGPMLNRHNT